MSTKIEWTDETWNPTVGCSKVSPGCDHCYAVGVAARQMQPAHEGLTADGDWTGEVRLLPDRLDQPLHWRKPRRVFVDSMSDLFHPDVPDDYIADVFAVMGAAAEHTFQVLTKRPQRMAHLLAHEEFGELVESKMGAHTHATIEPPLPNLWLGASIENQRYADLRIPHVIGDWNPMPWLSAEPMLGPIVLTEEHLAALRWVVVGGESGAGARPMLPQWAKRLRDQCQAAAVPFFFKQWGEWAPAHILEPHTPIDGGDGARYAMKRVGKKAAGRELDGRTWDELP